MALGRRTGDLVSHVWVIWNGVDGPVTRTDLVSYPVGADLLPVYGGWMHTFLGVGAARLGAAPEAAYTVAVVLVLLGTGIGGVALARAAGATRGSAAVAGLLLQLDGWVLYNATDGRPEHAGFGPLCLALAGAVATWRGQGGRWVPVATGLMGATVFVCGWEQALWLAVATAWLLVGLGRLQPTPGAWRRISMAAGVCVLTAAPWVGTFLSRALATRSADEGAHTLHHAFDQSLVLIPWLTGPGGQPTRLALAALVAVPWLCRSRDQRLWRWLGVGLLLSVLLAMGPTLGLLRPGDLHLPGPWRLVQPLPVLGWFHSPVRLAMGVSLASVVAVAIGLDWLRARSPASWRNAAVVGAAATLLATAWAEAHWADDWPRGGFKIPRRPDVRAVALRSGPGAVVELPMVREGIHAQDNQLRQLRHGRPNPGHPWLPWLVADRTPAALRLSPTLSWVSAGAEAEPPPPSSTAADTLRSEGYRFIGLSPRMLAPAHRQRAIAALDTAFGPSMTPHNDRWMSWDLQAPDAD